MRAGYDAPFPDKRFQAGARAFPRLVPTSPDDPAIPANRNRLGGRRPVGETVPVIFGLRDPILGHADRPLIAHVPGAAGQPHGRINGSHFVQEDCGPELAERILAWDTTLGSGNSQQAHCPFANLQLLDGNCTHRGAQQWPINRRRRRVHR